jgi:hypothetical protein
MPKLTAADVARLQALGDGWEDSEAAVTINAADAAALGFPLDDYTPEEEAKAKAKKKPLPPKLHATVTGNELFLATRDIQVGEEIPDGAEGTPNQNSLNPAPKKGKAKAEPGTDGTDDGGPGGKAKK